ANKALPPPKPETVLLQKPTAQLTPAEIKQVITRRANEALSLLVKHDYQKLEPYIHPQKGLRFSPYAHVDLKNDIVISGQQLARAASEPRKYQWGYYDGSGEPMKFTITTIFPNTLSGKIFTVTPLKLVITRLLARVTASIIEIKFTLTHFKLNIIWMARKNMAAWTGKVFVWFLNYMKINIT
ncbi:MAG TPA: hypothetical protein PKD56_14780, partial [Chitinophagales bacterium]|nr:hypothetical protein [Chitinophagales bacterium]